MLREINQHGVKIHVFETSHFGHTDKGGNWHNARIKVPEICWDCKNLDDGEYGEYGDCLCPPSCNLNIWMPTKVNKCTKKRVDNV